MGVSTATDLSPAASLSDLALYEPDKWVREKVLEVAGELGLVVDDELKGAGLAQIVDAFIDTSSPYAAPFCSALDSVPELKERVLEKMKAFQRLLADGGSLARGVYVKIFQDLELVSQALKTPPA